MRAGRERGCAERGAKIKKSNSSRALGPRSSSDCQPAAAGASARGEAAAPVLYVCVCVLKERERSCVSDRIFFFRDEEEVEEAG